ncbi:MAG TPA: methyltransferase domain-containing protein [Lysobacter sp.]|jgi:2-polyprenyl-3-methyl-5-hydroxy-6-metoxy-1,4-benzoquinol methylase|nr:methyltransferase domain-containing protein [Lysobacter sp.]
MNPSRLKQHVCPACRANQLVLKNAEGPTPDQIESGTIECRGCGKTYPVVHGLPRFVPASNYAESFGFQWNRHACTQLDSHSGLPISHDRLWTAIGGKADLHGQRVLEAGSGAGRFTEVLAASGADLVTFDYSSAVDANARNQAPNPRLHFFQGDIFNIPLAESSFDKVVCLGVVQHTPDPQAAFCSLSKYVRPGGQLVIDAYTRNFAALLQWKYLLRPITRRMRKETLYRVIEAITPPLVPVAKLLRRVAGRLGARLVPIVEYSHLGLSPELNVQWAILDTFDMYSPAHDHPQSLDTVTRWFKDAGFEDIHVRPGLNGVVGSGTRSLLEPSSR